MHLVEDIPHLLFRKIGRLYPFGIPTPYLPYSYVSSSKDESSLFRTYDSQNSDASLSDKSGRLLPSLPDEFVYKSTMNFEMVYDDTLVFILSALISEFLLPTIFRCRIQSGRIPLFFEIRNSLSPEANFMIPLYFEHTLLGIWTPPLPIFSSYLSLETHP